MAPTAEASAHAARQIGGKPILDVATGQRFVPLVAEQQSFGRVAGRAMTRAIDQEFPALPFGAGIGGNFGRVFVEIEPIPEEQPKTQIGGKDQSVGCGLLMCWLQAVQEAEQGICVLAAEASEIDVRKCGIEMLAAGSDTVMQGAVEFFRRPVADSGFLIGSNVGGIDSAEAGGEWHAAAERWLMFGRVAAGAVAQHCQIFPSRHCIFCLCRRSTETAEQEQQGW